MIRVLKTNEEYFEWKNSLNKETIGFAPTMGNIHAAHLSLLDKALEENDHGVISIYVNPTQFGEGEDFDAYPRTLNDDIEKISTLQKKHPHKDLIIYAPRESDIYPENFDQYLKADTIGIDLEGDLRPTHFDGVVTVVARLFEIVSPNKSYFGKKDYQQLKLVELMAKERFPSIEVIGMPIVREDNGLAMSSRNNYLSQEDKESALILRNALLKIEKLVRENKEITLIKSEMEKIKQDTRFNYLALKSATDFKEVTNFNSPIVILGNLQVNATRLLDNIEVL